MKDRWTELCESAVTELDRTKFRAILRELNEILDQRGSVPSRRQAKRYPSRAKHERECPQSPR
jgi:hypothetical protein